MRYSRNRAERSNRDPTISRHFENNSAIRPIAIAIPSANDGRLRYLHTILVSIDDGSLAISITMRAIVQLAVSEIPDTVIFGRSAESPLERRERSMSERITRFSSVFSVGRNASFLLSLSLSLSLSFFFRDGGFSNSIVQNRSTLFLAFIYALPGMRIH